MFLELGKLDLDSNMPSNKMGSELCFLSALSYTSIYKEEWSIYKETYIYRETEKIP